MQKTIDRLATHELLALHQPIGTAGKLLFCIHDTGSVSDDQLPSLLQLSRKRFGGDT